MNAMCLAGIDCRKAHASQTVFAWRDGLQVVRIDATGIPAQMVKVQPGCYRTFEGLKAEPVRAFYRSGKAHLAIAITVE